MLGRGAWACWLVARKHVEPHRPGAFLHPGAPVALWPAPQAESYHEFALRCFLIPPPMPLRVTAHRLLAHSAPHLAAPFDWFTSCGSVTRAGVPAWSLQQAGISMEDAMLKAMLQIMCYWVRYKCAQVARGGGRLAPPALACNSLGSTSGDVPRDAGCRRAVI